MSKEKVCFLYAEDNRSMKVVLDIMIEDSKYDINYKVLEYSKDLIKEFVDNKKAYDIVFLDQKLHEVDTMQGVDIAWNIHNKLGNEVPVYILSTSSGRIPKKQLRDSVDELNGMSELDASIEANCKGWIEKNSINLIDRIDRAIEHSKSSGNEFLKIDFNWQKND